MVMQVNETAVRKDGLEVAKAADTLLELLDAKKAS
jgi:hypothetical protein